MILMMYFGGIIFFNNEINLIYTPLRLKNGKPSSRLVLDTMIFHTFVLMNLFNQINSRITNSKETNIIKSLFNNAFFWVVIIVELFI